MVVRQKKPEELADAILTLLSNAGLRSAMAEEGRQYVLKHFDWDIIAEQYRSTRSEAHGLILGYFLATMTIWWQ